MQAKGCLRWRQRTRDRWGTLEELKITTFTRIIVGDLDLENGFAEFVEDWKKLGGDQITEEVSDWYRANQ